MKGIRRQVKPSSYNTDLTDGRTPSGSKDAICIALRGKKNCCIKVYCVGKPICLIETV